jgi:hypothetical protein
MRRHRLDRAAVTREYRASALAVLGFFRSRDDWPMLERQSRRYRAMARGHVPLNPGDTPEHAMAWAILYRHAARGRLPDFATCLRWRDEARAEAARPFLRRAVG